MHPVEMEPAEVVHRQTRGMNRLLTQKMNTKTVFRFYDTDIFNTTVREAVFNF